MYAERLRPASPQSEHECDRIKIRILMHTEFLLIDQSIKVKIGINSPQPG
jgi:hypothetical protein